MSRGKILVVRGGAIGDLILTLPALAALRKQFPQTLIEVLGYPHIASLAKLAGYADEVRSIEARALAGFFARGGDLDKTLCDYFADFDLIISYLYDPDEIFRTNVGRASRAQFIAGPYRPSDTGNHHATEVFLKPLERLAIFEADPAPKIDVGIQAPTTDAPQSSQPVIALHPGSGSEKKNWPEEHWAELLQRIVHESEWRILLAGGEAEQSRIHRLASLAPRERAALAMNLPLPELARRLASAHGFVGHDSGITHLAAAVGLRGVALWAESNPRVWQPRSGRFTLLHEPRGLAALNVSRVLAAASEMMQ